MTLQEIERDALQLPDDERAALAQKLLMSLDTISEAEIADEWLEEARRRAKDLDAGVVDPVPADEVRRKAMELLR